MGRRKIYTEEELRSRKRDAQRRYYHENKAEFEKRAIKYWVKKLTKAGYTVIAPGGGDR